MKAASVLLYCFGGVISGFAAQPSNDSLIRAIYRNDASAWQALLKAKADIAARDANGNTALHFAALNHDVAAVRALLAAGAKPDARNSAEATPLLYGAGHAEIVRLLLDRGANANAVSTLKNTPLMVAVSHPDSVEAAKLLLDAGADVHARRTTSGESVLARAVTGGDRRTLELLLARRAAEQPDALAEALAIASYNGDRGLVELLLKHGANPNSTVDFIGHALNRALMAEHLDVAQLLVEKGADLNIPSAARQGTPPMVWSAYNHKGDTEVARALIARGVDINAADREGSTALTYALRNGPETSLVKYLRSQGATTPERPKNKQVPNRPVPPETAARAALTRERMPAALHLLQRSSDAFLENAFVQGAKCSSCHGQDLPAVAYDLARARGFTLDDLSIGRQTFVLTERWKERAEFARQMRFPVGGAPVSIAYGMFGLRALHHEADDTTDAMTRWILRTQKKDGNWNDPTRRPPMEDGAFVATGWVALAVRDYAPKGYERAAVDSQARSARWLSQHEPDTHNEAVFQLLGLHWSSVPRNQLSAFTRKLAGTQRADGGWAQLPGLDSDAWATGSALYALHEAGGMKVTDPVYQRGVAFLLRTQFEDGSWWVRGRSWPFQPHFDGQFPHGKDQWISQGATAWAAIALLLTLDPVKPLPPVPSTRELTAAYAKSPAAQRKNVATAGTEAATTAKVDFTRDIQPVLERSCVGCHGGEKPRGGLAMGSRELLLKGGGSGEPAVNPGHGANSTMIQYASDKIEDLEMPPLDRREKYPALSATELELLRSWIDAGAPWPSEKKTE